MSALIASLALAASAVEASSAYLFQPESDTSYWKPDVPVVFDFAPSQFYNTVAGKPAASSYWTSSYLTGNNGQQFLVISHIFVSMDNSSYYRASTLSLDEPWDYNSYITYGNGSALRADSHLKATVKNNGFEGLSDDNIAQMRTFSNDDTITFDLTYNATTSAIVDGAVGLFAFGNGFTYEWGLPNCYTEGTINIYGKQLTVDPTKSFTWYDRQWNNGVPTTGNWTWFQLHIPNSRDKLSIWAVDNNDPEQAFRFATIRTEDGSQNVVPSNFTPDYTRQWHSDVTDTLYPLDWTITVGDYGMFRVSSAVDNQEIAGNTAFTTAYEGFVTFTGEYAGEAVDGFGVVEVLFSS
ncbi:Kievitone hydratase [Aspergillus arachidicola]|uniref:Kievitone hydratase n=1 Tax=Aspergillus arachidicola TaxID=656916 RepID=A0A5N6XNN5_9EURO|nr:Kievitone hydratase [Aspergillus arachidicola]